MKPSKFMLWWAQRPLREKLLMTVVASAGMLATADALVTAPLEKQVKRASGEANARDDKLQKLRQNQIGNVAQNVALRQQEAQWRERLLSVRTTATSMHRRVADAARLPETLRALVATVGQATLLELDLAGDAGEGGDLRPSASVSAVSTMPSSDPANGASNVPSAEFGSRRLYRLPITLKVSGSYQELHALLTQIENRAEALQWSSLTLDNSDWPAIQMTIKAHVLSHEPRWGSTT